MDEDLLKPEIKVLLDALRDAEKMLAKYELNRRQEVLDHIRKALQLWGVKK